MKDRKAAPLDRPNTRAKKATVKQIQKDGRCNTKLLDATAAWQRPSGWLTFRLLLRKWLRGRTLDYVTSRRARGQSSCGGGTTLASTSTID